MSVPRRSNPVKDIVVVLEANLKALKTAGSSDDFLVRYQQLITFVKRDGARIIFGSTTNIEARLPATTEGEIRALSIEQVAKLLEDDDTPRNYLELVAIVRFSVPKGSMRKFGSKDSLRDKIAVMLENERMHRTIGEVARGQPKVR